MEGSGETTDQYSRTSPSEENNNDDEEENDGRRNSSNKTDDQEMGKKPLLRPYLRSKTPRLRWTPDLHLRFLQAVERVGGLDRATPKLVLQLMNIRGLSIAHVKSHLQMYRSKRLDEHNYPEMFDNDQPILGVDHLNMFNLRQLPLLHSFHQRHSSNKFMSIRVKEEDLKEEFGLLHKQECHKRVQYSTQNSIYDHASSNVVQHRVHEQTRTSGLQRESTGNKRKASDFDLDLNLSLGIIDSRNDDENSSYSISSSTSIVIYKKLKEDFSIITKGASTLDLTL